MITSCDEWSGEDNSKGVALERLLGWGVLAWRIKEAREEEEHPPLPGARQHAFHTVGGETRPGQPHANPDRAQGPEDVRKNTAVEDK